MCGDSLTLIYHHAMQVVKVVLAFAALAFVPSEGAKNRAATGLASKVAGLMRGGAMSMCNVVGEYCKS